MSRDASHLAFSLVAVLLGSLGFLRQMEAALAALEADLRDLERRLPR